MEQKNANVMSPFPELGSSSTPIEKEAVVVGFENEEMKIMERLIGKPKHLDVISIVGMAGIGKTTLALKVYNNPTTAHHFDIRAWISVSQVYQKRDLILEMFSSPYIRSPFNMDKMDDAKLSEALYKCLKGNRYLIFMDDVWNNEAWDELKRSFPNDNTGSRIMLTSRIRDVALHAKAGSIPHDLRFLSKEESWDLLQEKVFQRDMICPTELVEIGKEIAEKCYGLPLAIVVVAGVLSKKEKTEYMWKEVLGTMRLSITRDLHHYMKTLDLSYSYLPDHLKPCFLYFGTFPEDYEITVTKLTWLWMAEGFVVKSDGKKLEDAAENYLTDLIERSLLLVVKRRSNGRVKSCRIHDLLHELCLNKIKEGNFMQQIIGYEKVSSLISTSSSSWYPYDYQPLFLYIRSSCSGNLRFEHSQTLSYFGQPWFVHESIISQKFKRLKVLDLLRITFSSYPTEIEQLQHVRYIAIRAQFVTIPASISNVQNLETLIVKGMSGSISIDFALDKMVKLRHLRIDPSNSLKLGGSLIVGELQTISTPSFDFWDQSYSRSIPNLHKLRCALFYNKFYARLSGFEFLHKLETLKIFYYGETRYITLFDLPTSLKKVTLLKFRLGWTEISKLARLPNLEVLKLLHNSFEGKLWDTTSMGCDLQTFPKLKFLKLETLNIMEWLASKDDFPSLQQLVLSRCRQLKEIPSELFEIPTLETIELNWCSSTAVDSSKQLLQEQREMGNEQLEILVYPPNSSSHHSF